MHMFIYRYRAMTDEALLATLFIFIVHGWNVHYSPEVFPMSKAWLTGNLSEKQMKHEHAWSMKRQ